MADYQAYFNGEWMPFGEVTISPSDRGFSVGDLVFEVERTFNGRPFRLKEHIERLYRSLTYIRMDAGLSAEEMTAITEEAVERAKADHPGVTDFWMRQIVTRGTVDLFDPPAPTVLVQVGEQGFWYADLYDTGLHGVISKTRAYSPQALDPKIKHYSRMNFVLAHQEANDVEPGAWPILLDDRGFLAEGNGQNVFVVTDGVIRTPTDYAALQGVSRGMAIDLTRQLDIPLVEEDLQPYDLYTADEAFWTTTSMCVMPMTQVDRRAIGDGKPGPMSQRLLAAWSEAVGVDVVGQAQQYNERDRLRKDVSRSVLSNRHLFCSRRTGLAEWSDLTRFAMAAKSTDAKFGCVDTDESLACPSAGHNAHSCWRRSSTWAFRLIPDRCPAVSIIRVDPLCVPTGAQYLDRCDNTTPTHRMSYRSFMRSSQGTSYSCQKAASATTDCPALISN